MAWHAGCIEVGEGGSVTHRRERLFLFLRRLPVRGLGLLVFVGLIAEFFLGKGGS